MTKNIIIFGSSFVGTFMPLKSKNIEIIKFKGAMIKGLINKNENYQSILKKLKNKKYEYGIFVFGDPDCNFYYYKKKYIDNQNGNMVDKNLLQYASNYVELISNLSNIKNKYILGASPPTIIDDEIFRHVLKTYNIMDEQQIKNISKKDLLYINRFQRNINFNKSLEKACTQYKVNYCSIFNLIIDKNNYMDKHFRILYNPYNIHYNFEAALIAYLNIPCLSFIIDPSITNITYNEAVIKLRNLHDDYIKELMNKFNTKYSNIYNLNINAIEKLVQKRLIQQ